ncbi:hypothetical protein ACHQM5_000951 [Ranunculus cassubicifolius]
MADQNPSIYETSPYKLLGIVHNSDDTLTRLLKFPSSSITPDNSSFIKDIPLNATNNTWLRVFRPIELLLDQKLPVILYFHGGGFILCSASSTMFHDNCVSMANRFPAIIVSVEYRLAPESRLPGAYEDGMEALDWVQKQAVDENGEKWLKDSADFSKVFVMGCSSGGNIAYHVGLRALSLKLSPLIIKGLIINQPYFGGLKRTQSELNLVNDKVLPLNMTDLMWELALPKGSDRNHEYCYPMVEGSSLEDKIGLLGRCFVSVRGKDPLMDRQKEFVEMLVRKGVDVVHWFEPEGCHGMEILGQEHALPLHLEIKKFIYSV